MEGTEEREVRGLILERKREERGERRRGSEQETEGERELGRWEKRRWKKRWRKSSRLGLLSAKFRDLRLRGSGATVGLLRTGERISRSIAESYEFFNFLNLIS